LAAATLADETARARSSSLAVSAIDDFADARGERGGLLQRHVHVGQAVLQHLEARDRHAELLALAHVVERVAQQAAHDADRFGADGERGLVQRAFDLRQRAAFGAEQCLGGQAHVVEGDVGGAAAVARRVGAQAQAGRVPGHHEQRQALLAARRDDEMAGPRRRLHHGLAAIEPEAVALAHELRLHVVARVAALRFAVREGQHGLPRDDAREQRIGLCTGVALQQAGADHHRRQVRLGRERAAQRFHQREVRGHAQAQAAVRFGQRRAQQIEFAREALPERRRRIVGSRERMQALLEAVVVVQVAREAVAQHREGVVLFGACAHCKNLSGPAGGPRRCCAAPRWNRRRWKRRGR
jgi:hypothetical protein